MVVVLGAHLSTGLNAIASAAQAGTDVAGRVMGSIGIIENTVRGRQVHRNAQQKMRSGLGIATEGYMKAVNIYKTLQSV